MQSTLKAAGLRLPYVAFPLMIPMVLITVATCPSSADETMSPVNVLREAAHVHRQRSVLIDDYMRWAQQLTERAKKPMKPPSIPKNLDDPEQLFKFRMSLSAYLAKSRKVLANYLYSLNRFRAIEAAPLAMDHFDLTVKKRYGPGAYRPGEDLLVTIGRPASALIVKRIHATPMPNEADAAVLETILRKTEGSASEILMKNPPAISLPSRRKQTAERMQIRFAVLPGMQPGDANLKSVRGILNFDKHQLVDGPSFQPDRYAAGVNKVKSFAEAIGEFGDFAVLEGAILVPSCQMKSFGVGSLGAYSEKDLSHVDLEEYCFQYVGFSDQVWLIKTKDQRYALITNLGPYKKQGMFAYLYQPDGTAKFGAVTLMSPIEIREKKPAATVGQLMAYGSYKNTRENSLLMEYSRLRPLLEKVASRTVSAVTPQQQARALQFLGDLRYFESIELIVEQLASKIAVRNIKKDDVEVRALLQMVPACRSALMSRLDKAATQSNELRARWYEVLELIEGQAVARAISREAPGD